MAENDFSIVLSDEQRFCIASVFDQQKVQIQDYNAALIWKETFDRVTSGWDWPKLRRLGRAVISEPDRLQQVTLSPSNGHVLVLQLLVAMREGTYDGGEVRIMVEAIEMVREHVPGLIRLDQQEQSQAGS